MGIESGANNRRAGRAAFLLAAAIGLVGAGSRPAFGEEPEKPIVEGTPAADGTIPLNKNSTVLIDKQRKRVLLKAHVALREGTLEQLCCLKQTKEHESILSLDAKAYAVHAALLAIGAKSGTPVRFNPDYVAPTGQTIEIFLSWTDEKGKALRVPAHHWVRNATRRFWGYKLDSYPKGLKLPKNDELRYDQKLKELSWYGPMTARQKDEYLALSSHPDYRKGIEYFFDQSKFREMQARWVFAGSGFFKDEDTGKEYYLAEDGDLICVANFPGATIDVAIESSAQGDNLMFEAWTERIPPRETPVTIELIPNFEKAP
jgi:hypothetical protein